MANKTLSVWWTYRILVGNRSSTHTHDWIGLAANRSSYSFPWLMMAKGCTCLKLWEISFIFIYIFTVNLSSHTQQVHSSTSSLNIILQYITINNWRNKEEIKLCLLAGISKALSVCHYGKFAHLHLHNLSSMQTRYLICIFHTQCTTTEHSNIRTFG